MGNRLERTDIKSIPSAKHLKFDSQLKYVYLISGNELIVLDCLNELREVFWLEHEYAKHAWILECFGPVCAFSTKKSVYVVNVNAGQIESSEKVVCLGHLNQITSLCVQENTIITGDTLGKLYFWYSYLDSPVST